MAQALHVLIPLLMKETNNEPDELMWCLSELSDIMDTLKQHEDFNNAEISALGVQIDAFSPCRIEM
jgi:hypothetical protein